MRTGIYGLLVLMLLGTLAACGKSAAERWQEQYDLGIKYLEEQNYEEAIVALRVPLRLIRISRTLILLCRIFTLF